MGWPQKFGIISYNEKYNQESSTHEFLFGRQIQQDLSCKNSDVGHIGTRTFGSPPLD